MMQAERPPLPPGVRGIFDVVYARAGGRVLHMDLALPEKKSGKPLPAIVWIHGGGWQGGSYQGSPAAQFVPKGYVAASIEYRLSQEAVFPAQIYDCKAAIRFLRANADGYGIDPNRIGVWGGSAGGHLAALLGASGGVSELEGDLGNAEQSSRVQAVCDFFGPAKFLVEGDEPEAVRQIPETVTQLFGGTRDEKPELHRLGSPFAHISPDDPPFLIVHGENDEIVPIGQSVLFRDALLKAGVEAELIEVKGGDHGCHAPGQRPDTAEIEERVLEFFDKHLKPKPSP